MVLTRRQTSYSSVDIDYTGYDQSVKSFSSSNSSFGDRYSDPEGNNRPSSNSSRKTGKCTSVAYTIFMLLQIAALGFLGFTVYTTNGELTKTTSELEILNGDYSVLRESLSETETELEQARNVFSVIKRKMSEIDPRGTWSQNGSLNVEESKALFETIVKRHNAQSSRIDALQKNIQQLHLHELESRYGPGPYKVEFTFIIGETKKFLTIETAPISLMPHSIHSFMRMIEVGTWDNTVLINGDHILIATMKNRKGEVKQLPQTHGSTSLMFPEYSSEYPHNKYTLGFVGKPGGPEFYINLRDNDKIHGRRGDEADPCFAKVVRGIDLFEEIKGNNVAVIERAAILNPPRKGN